MSNIIYNEKEEAFELPYTLWDKPVTVRFYVEEKSDIMNNIAGIAEKLEKLNRNKKNIAELIINEGYYEDEETLKDTLTLESVYVDIDEDGIVVCFSVDSNDGHMGKLSMELGADNEIEAVGWV